MHIWLRWTLYLSRLSACKRSLARLARPPGRKTALAQLPPRPPLRPPPRKLRLGPGVQEGGVSEVNACPMHVYMYTCMCTYMYTYICTYEYMYVCICYMYIYIYTYIRMYMSVYTYMYAYIYMYINVYNCMNV